MSFFCFVVVVLKVKPCNKSFIDQACSVKLASFFFCVFMDRDEVEVHKNAKKELGQYPAILTSRLVNNAYISHLSVKFRGSVLSRGADDFITLY